MSQTLTTDHKLTLDQLPGIYLLVMQRRYEGKRYEVIAEEVGFAAGSLRHWFEKGGKLYDYYEEYKKQQNEIVLREGEEIRKKNIRNAWMIVSSKLASKDEKVQLAAAKMIFEREYGMPGQNNKNLNINMNMTLGEYVNAITNENESDVPESTPTETS